MEGIHRELPLSAPTGCAASPAVLGTVPSGNDGAAHNARTASALSRFLIRSITCPLRLMVWAEVAIAEMFDDDGALADGGRGRER